MMKWIYINKMLRCMEKDFDKWNNLKKILEDGELDEFIEAEKDLN